MLQHERTGATYVKTYWLSLPLAQEKTAAGFPTRLMR